MGHVTSETDWCNIDINTETGFIFFQQRWHYTWLPGTQPEWTLAEKRNFHNRCDRAIWKEWSDRVKLAVKGTSGFAKKFSKSPVAINLDVRWVLAKQHWNAYVTKIAVGDFLGSKVEWNDRKIYLDSEDFKISHKCSTIDKAEVCRDQIPVAHEFGHAAGNSWVFETGDEYNESSPHYNDVDSALNIGTTVRSRHFGKILEEMNKMIPNTTFSVHSIKE